MSNRQKAANQRTQEAVDRATAALRAENEALKARLPKEPPAAPAPKAPTTTPETFPEWETWQEQPENANKTFTQYLDAHGEWRDARRTAASASAAREHAGRQEHVKRVTTYQERIATAIAADAKFVESLSDDVRALKPFNELGKDETPTAYNAIAEEILESEVAPELMRYFTAKPEELHRLAGLPPRSLIREIGRIEERLAKGEPAGPAPPKQQSNAPRPGITLGDKSAAAADPIESAVANDDVSAYRATRLAQRTANLRR